uniref:CSON010618 protein n=1 Tax=Culicoides sonorensis TaxID=179676 RepID=A0A336M223_CULSO
MEMKIDIVNVEIIEIHSCPPNIFLEFVNINEIFITKSFYDAIEDFHDMKLCFDRNDLGKMIKIKKERFHRKNQMLKIPEKLEKHKQTRTFTDGTDHNAIFFAVLSVFIFFVLLAVIFYCKCKHDATLHEINVIKEQQPPLVISFPMRYNFKTCNEIYRVPALDKILATISEESLPDVLNME